MSSTNFNIRMDENLKQRAFPVIESYGLTPAQAVKLFLTQIADTKTIPLTFNHNQNRIPNAETVAAMQEIIDDRKDKKLKRYNNLDEMITDIREISE